MPIEIEATVIQPASIVCPHCKQETGLTHERIFETSCDGDFNCPHCQKVVFSCKPEVKTYSYAYAGGSAYDYD
jgi:transposase-like protein